MFLLAGLGNPGLKYQYTKHNFGFLLADLLAQKYNLTAEREKFGGQIFSGEIVNEKIILAKPMEYMNNSGFTIQGLVNFYKIPLKNVIIFHDDLDLALGRIKVKIGGGNGGHNGLKDIDEKIGRDYLRVRLGIDRPQNKEYEISDYVLSKFSSDEIQIVEKVNQKIADLLPSLLVGRTDEFMNKFVTSS